MKRFFSFLIRWTVRACVIGLTLYVAYLFYQPDVTTLKEQNPTTTALIDLRKQQARQAHAPYDMHMTWRDLDEISPNLVHAVILAEDDTFYQHHGFDLNEIREAIKINWKKKRWAYGGSTITQQLARNLYLSPKKNLLRKLKEAVITFRLERTLRKKRILEIYLNVVEWGPGIYGAEAAAEFYYSKPAIDLTPDEAVALASILPSPRRWSPVSEKTFMARRRTKLLERMQRAGYAPPAFNDYFPENAFDPSVVPLSTGIATPNENPNENPDELLGVTEHEAPQLSD